MPDLSASRDTGADGDALPLADEPAAGESSAGDEPATADEPAGFQNRAARRAKGKSPSQSPTHGKGPQFRGRGSVQGPRQWGNRRSG